MIKSLVKKTNSTNIAVDWIKNEYPNEKIIFASPATILEVNSPSPIKWHQTFFTRNATLIFTKDKFFIKNNLISPSNALYMLFLVIWLVLYTGGKDWNITNWNLTDWNLNNWTVLIWCFLFSYHIFTQLPYQQQIIFTDIQKVKLNSMRGFTKEFFVYKNKKVIHIVSAQILPEKVLSIISSHTKTIVCS